MGVFGALAKVIGALPDARNVAEDMARRILELRNAGRADEVTEAMMDLADDPYMYANTPIDMGQDALMTRAEEMDINVDLPLYHGGPKSISSIDPSKLSGFDREKGAFYTSTSPEYANSYGRIIHKLYGRTPKDALVVDAQNKGFYQLTKDMPTSQGVLGDVVPNVIKKWGDEKLHTDMIAAGSPSDTVIFENIIDPGKKSFYKKLPDTFENEKFISGRSIVDQGHSATTRADLDPANLRSSLARFDPEFRHLRNLSAGFAAIGFSGLAAGLKEKEEGGGI